MLAAVAAAEAALAASARAAAEHTRPNAHPRLLADLPVEPQPVLTGSDEGPHIAIVDIEFRSAPAPGQDASLEERIKARLLATCQQTANLLLQRKTPREQYFLQREAKERALKPQDEHVYAVATSLACRCDLYARQQAAKPGRSEAFQAIDDGQQVYLLYLVALTAIVRERRGLDHMWAIYEYEWDGEIKTVTLPAPHEAMHVPGTVLGHDHTRHTDHLKAVAALHLEIAAENAKKVADLAPGEPTPVLRRPPVPKYHEGSMEEAYKTFVLLKDEFGLEHVELNPDRMRGILLGVTKRGAEKMKESRERGKAAVAGIEASLGHVKADVKNLKEQVGLCVRVPQCSAMISEVTEQMRRDIVVELRKEFALEMRAAIRQELQQEMWQQVRREIVDEISAAAGARRGRDESAPAAAAAPAPATATAVAPSRFTIINGAPMLAKKAPPPAPKK